MPILKPVLPDPGVPFQLVHHDDVASAIRAAALGRGAPGVYNLAGPGRLTVAELARELGWYSIPVPELAVDAVAEMVGRLGFLPAQAQWVSAFREPVIMSTAKGTAGASLASGAQRPPDVARDDHSRADGSAHSAVPDVTKRWGTSASAAFSSFSLAGRGLTGLL